MRDRRLLAWLIAALVVVLALPLLLAAGIMARAVLVPPVPNALLHSFDGVDVSGNCTDRAATHGGRVLLCSGHMRASSLYLIDSRDSDAAAWCMAQIDKQYYGTRQPIHLGPVTVGFYPPVPGDWSSCHDMLPIQSGVFVEFMLRR